MSARDLLPQGAPRLGLGCADLCAGQDAAASLRLVQTAYDYGIRYFDVARMYGNGRAETLVGRALQHVRDRVVIASKVGILPWGMLPATRLGRKIWSLSERLAPGLWPCPAGPPTARGRLGAYRRAELMRSVEASLRALRTDYLDLLLLHECELAEAMSPVTLDVLQALRAAGKIRTFGIATRFPQTMAILEAAPERFPVAQFASDLFSRNEQSLPSCWRGLIITHTILKGGLSRLVSEAQPEALQTSEWLRRFGAVADREAWAGLLLQGALASHDGIVLFGTTKPERIASNLKAAQATEAAWAVGGGLAPAAPGEIGALGAPTPQRRA